MRNVMIILVLITSINHNIDAQFLKKLKDKANELVEAQTPKPLDANVSQSVMAKGWEEKVYTCYKIASGGCYEDGTLKLTLGKDANGLVTSIKLDDVLYDRDEEGKSDFIRFFSSKKGNQKVMFLQDKILLFSFSDRTFTKISGRYYLGKKGSYSDIQKAEEYLKAARVNQTADLDAYAAKQAAEKAAKLAARKEKYGLEGKSVKKIEVTDISAEHFGYYRPITFHVTATLADGRKISTKNGGFWEDYDIKYPNASINKISGLVEAKSFIKGDEVIIEVVNKHDRSIKTTGRVPMVYGEDLKMRFNAQSWGKSAHSFKVEVKQVKHTLDGSDILMIRFSDVSGEYNTETFKMSADKTLYIFADGQDGHKTVRESGNYGFVDNGPGQNGGNGGNITVIKDPSVKVFNLEYSNKGGIGGSGTAGYNRGQNGRDGRFKETVRTVNF